MTWIDLNKESDRAVDYKATGNQWTGDEIAMAKEMKQHSI